VAILGARGIGAIHARIFRHCGARVTAVLGSSLESAGEACHALVAADGTEPEPFGSLDDLLRKTRPDAVSLCTPPELHLDQILESLDHGAAVFCEKPLFWREGIGPQEIATGIQRIRERPNRRIMVNTSNTHLLEAALAHSGTGPPRESFRFCFHTLGNFQGSAIAADLLPHGLSLLIALWSEHAVEGLEKSSEDRSWSGRFRYDGRNVQFLFEQDPEGERGLWFELDGRRFTRIQEGSGAAYQVFLEDDSGNRFRVQDPFQVRIRKFLAGEETFEQDAANLRLMGEILLGNS